MTQTNPKTILYFNHTAKWSGGEIGLFHLIQNLDRTHYTPLVVLAEEGKLADKLREIGCETIVLPLPGTITEARKDNLGLTSLLQVRQGVYCFAYAMRLARLLHQRRVALVHCNSLKADLIGGLACRMARVPCIWHIRDHIDENYLPPRVARLFKTMTRRVPTAIIANSQSTLATLQLPPDTRVQSIVAYTGIPMEEFASIPPLTAADFAAPRLTLVGRIARWKGQDVFIEAAAQIAPRWRAARFCIVGSPMFGEDDYAAELRDLVRQHGMQEQFEFLGFQDDIPAVMKAATVVIHASTLREPFGKVIVEGMAASRPVVATDGGALREIVVPGSMEGSAAKGETGLLVPLGDADAMARAMETLLHDPERALAMGTAGRCRAEDLFTAQITTKQVEAMYGQMLAIAGETAQSKRSERKSDTICL